MKRKLSLLIAALIAPSLLLAQVDIDKEMEEFDDFVKQQQQEFRHFVDEQNKEFARFLEETWKEYGLQKAVAPPKEPKPVKPLRVDINKPRPKPRRIKVGSLIKTPTPIVVTPTPPFAESKQKTPTPVMKGSKAPTTPLLPVTRPVTPISSPDNPIIAENMDARKRRNAVEFTFYGIPCAVDASLKNKLRLKGVKEKEVAAGWEKLADANYQALINDCLALKAEHGLNDYGYILLTRKVAAELCGADRNNEATLLQMFIACQSGYKTKIARTDQDLVFLYAPEEKVYSTTFITIDGQPYYLQDSRRIETASLYTYKHDFGNATHKVELSLQTVPSGSVATVTRTYQSKKYPQARVQSVVSTGLIEFYKDYAACDVPIYARTPASTQLQATLMVQLRPIIQGKKADEVANILINFVQTAFEYATDNEQFGYEKPFFVDEIFFYPYSDCEDRSILFAYLVRNLLNLDVVLLRYPGHMATAVCFPEPVEGDYFIIEGKQYTVCDPTFINASIGETMTTYQNVSPEVIRY
ncbi:MAG: hypothetical protein LBN06_05695 [Prevotellaceae bacterium]|jgi:hypothetical protein|nr:hypothetical protein [Prevotellaceae bacterium]